MIESKKGARIFGIRAAIELSAIPAVNEQFDPFDEIGHEF